MRAWVLRPHREMSQFDRLEMKSAANASTIVDVYVLHLVREYLIVVIAQALLVASTTK